MNVNYGIKIYRDVYFWFWSKLLYVASENKSVRLWRSKHANEGVNHCWAINVLHDWIIGNDDRIDSLTNLNSILKSIGNWNPPSLMTSIVICSVVCIIAVKLTPCKCNGSHLIDQTVAKSEVLHSRCTRYTLWYITICSVEISSDKRHNITPVY